MPALISCTQALGEPRYPSLKGIMAARSKEIATRSLADLGIDPATVGGAVATTTVLDSRIPPARGGHRDRPRVSRGRGRGPDRRVPRRSGGSSDGRAVGHRRTRSRTAAWQASAPRSRRSRASLARQQPAATWSGSSWRRTPRRSPTSSPRYLPSVLAIADPAAAGDHAWSAHRRGARRRPCSRQAPPSRRTRSSSAPDRMAATSPGPCRR